MKKQPLKNKSFYICSVLALLTFAACEGSLNERVGKVTQTIKKVDSASVKVSKGLTKFTKEVEGYVDTTAYKKDSTGTWHEKKEKTEKPKGGVFDSIFKTE